jgi:hypothetical protein
VDPPTFWERVRIFLVRAWRSLVGEPPAEPVL